jgi:hypothetical protein
MMASLLASSSCEKFILATDWGGLELLTWIEDIKPRWDYEEARGGLKLDDFCSDGNRPAGTDELKF